ncbi:hypothetical protein NXT3_PB00288 (plasmid) [Sinorhizobium fredii]|uniref:Uncharacterized protein n=1 Tax=Rhizobium fredii TaxID=380 RepID=A0A2L0HBV6_RHIFR|nr:hypothetical protein NXT3_PB00288 [Sinorhizobium fredii]
MYLRVSLGCSVGAGGQPVSPGQHCEQPEFTSSTMNRKTRKPPFAEGYKAKWMVFWNTDFMWFYQALRLLR